MRSVPSLLAIATLIASAAFFAFAVAGASPSQSSTQSVVVAVSPDPATTILILVDDGPPPPDLKARSANGPDFQPQDFGPQISSFASRAWTQLAQGARFLRQQSKRAAKAIEHSFRRTEQSLAQNWTALQPQLRDFQSGLSESLTQLNRLTDETLSRFAQWYYGRPAAEPHGRGKPISV